MYAKLVIYDREIKLNVLLCLLGSLFSPKNCNLQLNKARFLLLINLKIGLMHRESLEKGKNKLKNAARLLLKTALK